MADQRNGGIAWTEETWNPLRGCSRVSAGCMNCYAESMAARFCGAGQPYEGTINPETKHWNGTIKLVPEKLADPLRWQRHRMVFVNSMSDLFHEDVPDAFIDQVFAVMALAKQHTFQVLTKRPERMLDYLRDMHPGSKRVLAIRQATSQFMAIAGNPAWPIHFPLPNVWLGATVENQEAADERIPLLLQTPAAVRWVSMEPLLGPVDLDSENAGGLHALGCGDRQCDCGNRGIDWVVVGGESGPHARLMHPDWVRILRDQCTAAGVPFMFKQWGEWAPYDRGRTDRSLLPADARNSLDMPLGRPGKKAAGRLLDGVQHDGFPEVRHV